MKLCRGSLLFVLALLAVPAMGACHRTDGDSVRATGQSRARPVLVDAAGAGPSAGPAVIFAPAGGGGELRIGVEVAATEQARRRGLMYRQHLPPDAGMLFLMEGEGDHSFYMRNTLIPLDLIFVGRDMKVVGIIENAEPRSLTPRTIGKPSFYVVEVNGGWTGANGVRTGRSVRFENLPP